MRLPAARPPRRLDPVRTPPRDQPGRRAPQPAAAGQAPEGQRQAKHQKAVERWRGVPAAAGSREMRAIGEFHDAKTVKNLLEPASRHATAP
jgi:hypothetical protein